MGTLKSESGQLDQLARQNGDGCGCPSGRGSLCEHELLISLRCHLVACCAVGGRAAAVARNNAGLLALNVGVESRHPGVHFVGISGAKGRDHRPGLDAMMKAVNAKEFDMVASWSVDRLGRSLTDLLSILQGLHEKRVGLFLHQQGLDTSTTAGKAMFQMLGVFAEFEREIIRERVNAGLARAKANGTKLGRRRVKPSFCRCSSGTKACGRLRDDER
jgi:DNA invertase Pin-like site-specific DNA recombinase